MRGRSHSIKSIVKAMVPTMMAHVGTDTLASQASIIHNTSFRVGIEEAGNATDVGLLTIHTAT
jgi:hypothetical protein